METRRFYRTRARTNTNTATDITSEAPDCSHAAEVSTAQWRLSRKHGKVVKIQAERAVRASPLKTKRGTTETGVTGSKSDETHDPVDEVKVSFARYRSERKCTGSRNILCKADNDTVDKSVDSVRETSTEAAELKGSKSRTVKRRRRAGMVSGKKKVRKKRNNTGDLCKATSPLKRSESSEVRNETDNQCSNVTVYVTDHAVSDNIIDKGDSNFNEAYKPATSAVECHSPAAMAADHTYAKQINESPSGTAASGMLFQNVSVMSVPSHMMVDSVQNASIFDGRLLDNCQLLPDWTVTTAVLPLHEHSANDEHYVDYAIPTGASVVSLEDSQLSCAPLTNDHGAQPDVFITNNDLYHFNPDPNDMGFSDVEPDIDKHVDPDFVPDSCDSDDSSCDVYDVGHMVSKLVKNMTQMSSHNVVASIASGSEAIEVQGCAVEINSPHDAVTSVGSTSHILTENDELPETSASPLPASVTVAATANSPGGRCYDKRFYCLYCERPQAKLKTHLISQHGDEQEVAEMCSIADRSAQKNVLTRLRNLGNHRHNSQVIRAGSGILVVAYRPKEAADPNNYAPCPHCFGYYEIKQIWKHCKKRCPLAPQATNSASVLSQARYLLPVSHAVTASTRQILSVMQRDSIYKLSVNDELIMKFAEKLTLKHFSDRDKHEYVRAKIRELGRLLASLKSSFNINSIREAIDPAHFQKVINCVRTVSGFDCSTGMYKTPSLALKLGHAMKKCAVLLKSAALQESNKELEVKSDAFLQLCDMEWTSEVSSMAMKTLRSKKMNKTAVLPLTRDISKLSSYLSNIVDDSIAKLTSDDTEDKEHAWMSLAEALLAQIVMFNRRRSGELSKVTVSTYNNAMATNINTDTDVHKHLSGVEQNLCQQLHRLEIPGKKGSIVPVLLTRKYKEAVDCLITNRHKGHVSEENSYMFARPRSDGHIRCCDVLRKYAVECGAEVPQTLTSTRLRKHIATISQVLNLKHNELDLLAQFLGHDINVHRQYYRLPADVLQTAKVAKILMAVENGEQKLTGKCLDDIDVDLEAGVSAFYIHIFIHIIFLLIGSF